MPPFLGYDDYELESASGSHLFDFQPPNEEEEPTPPENHCNHLEETECG
jgi:hypothetical protein